MRSPQSARGSDLQRVASNEKCLCSRKLAATGLITPMTWATVSACQPKPIAGNARSAKPTDTATLHERDRIDESEARELAAHALVLMLEHEQPGQQERGHHPGQIRQRHRGLVADRPLEHPARGDVDHAAIPPVSRKVANCAFRNSFARGRPATPR